MVKALKHIETYADIDTIETMDGVEMMFISHSVAYARCGDPQCLALHVLMRESPHAPYRAGVSFSVEMLDNMLALAQMIKKGKQQ